MLKISNVEIYDYCPASTSDQNDEDGAKKTFLNRCFTIFRELFVVSNKNWSARKYLRSRSVIDEEKQRQLENYPYVIHPYSVFRHWWHIFMVLVVNIGLIGIPYQASFDMKKQTYKVWNTIKHVIIFICIIDIIINFLTGYFDSLKGSTELKFQKISKHYLKSLFIFDLIGSFPTDVIRTLWSNTLTTHEASTFIFVARSASVISYTHKICRYYRIRQSVFEFYSLLYWCMILLHWQACIFWFVPSVKTFPEKYSNGSWINSPKLINDEDDIYYRHCMYRSIHIFFKTGFPVENEFLSIEEQFLMTIFLLISTPIFCLFLARASKCFINSNSAKLKYESLMASVKLYLSHNQLPPLTQERMKEYYENKFYKRYFREHEINTTLSINIQQEHRMHATRKLLENVVFLNKLPPSQLAQLVTLLKSEIYLTNDVIFEANQTGNCMYFIASGTVAVYNPQGEEIFHLKDGAHFGEIAVVVHDAKRIATIVAIETCKVYKLERLDFAKIIHPYPKLWEQIKETAIEWHEKMGIRKLR